MRTLTAILLLSFSALFFNGCASLLTTPQKDCASLCKGHVEFFKSDDLQCQCRGEE